MTRQEKIKYIKAKDSFYAFVDFIGYDDKQLDDLYQKVRKAKSNKKVYAKEIQD